MAKYQSDGMAPPKPTGLINCIQHGGHVRMDVCKFTAPAALAVGDEIELFKLPARSKLLPNLSAFASEATATLELTDYTNPVALADYASLAGEGLEFDTPIESTGKVLTAKVTAGSLAVGAVVYFHIAYVTSVG